MWASPSPWPSWGPSTQLGPSITTPRLAPGPLSSTAQQARLPSISLPQLGSCSILAIQGHILAIQGHILAIQGQILAIQGHTTSSVPSFHTHRPRLDSRVSFRNRLENIMCRSLGMWPSSMKGNTSYSSLENNTSHILDNSFRHILRINMCHSLEKNVRHNLDSKVFHSLDSNMFHSQNNSL